MVRGRARIPEHAFSEADRLLARPQEAVRAPRIKATLVCWRNRNGVDFTAHEGIADRLAKKFGAGVVAAIPGFSSQSNGVSLR